MVAILIELTFYCQEKFLNTLRISLTEILENINFDIPFVIPAKAGIQNLLKYWMPDQVRHDKFGIAVIIQSSLTVNFAIDYKSE
jgi:hypothetical protein